MRQNEKTSIQGTFVTLVPYENHHVPKYHEWMKSEELQKLTASEPLTLEEEYQMQRSWREDENKCTFIILDSATYLDTREKEIEAMVGDVNLFFNDEDDKTSAEIEIMIAESRCRGKGLGREALYTMMRYASDNLGIQRFTAKIGMDNTPSLSMFNKIGFKEISRSEVFEEITFELPVTTEVKNMIEKQTENYSISAYER